MASTAPKNRHGMVCIISPVERFQPTNSASSHGMVRKISKVLPGSHLAELVPPLSSLSHSGLIVMAFTGELGCVLGASVGSLTFWQE